MDSMFNLPASTIVNRFIPKEKFYKKTAVNNKLRRLFTDEIDKITWQYKISPDTLNIAKDDKLEEIQIFEIFLKGATISRAVLRHIDSSIPYPIIYILKRSGDSKVKTVTSIASVIREFGTKSRDKDFIDSGWSSPSGQFALSKGTLAQVYVGYIMQIIGIYTQPYSDPKKALISYEQNIETRKQIDAINKKIANEPSVAKRQELARQRHALEQQMSKV